MNRFVEHNAAPAAVPFLDLIEATTLADMLGVSLKFVQRRMANRSHKEHIPNIKVGRKRFVRKSDLQQWLDGQRSVPLLEHEKCH